jgi:hypothetical protein
MLGTGKTVWQAEIDASVETIDFLRLNTVFAESIYQMQPTLNSPNVWNRMEYRELEVTNFQVYNIHNKRWKYSGICGCYIAFQFLCHRSKLMYGTRNYG